MVRKLALLTLVAALAACGVNRTERALTGGAIGAGTGALGALVLDGNVGTGVVAGGLIGAAIGGLTGPGDIDLSHRRHYRRSY